MAKKPKVVYSKNRQTSVKGKKYSSKLDNSRKALTPGKRISKNGNIYYEYRKNRSDIKGVDTPKKKTKKKVVRKSKIEKDPYISIVRSTFGSGGAWKNTSTSGGLYSISGDVSFFNIPKSKPYVFVLQEQDKKGRINFKTYMFTPKEFKIMRGNSERNFENIGFPVIIEFIVKKQKKKDRFLNKVYKKYVV